MRRLALFLLALLVAVAAPALAQTNYAARLTEGDVVLRDFAFAGGGNLAELNIHYATLGTPRRDAAGQIVNAVMGCFTTGGSGQQFLAPKIRQRALRSRTSRSTSAVTTYILPDGIGHGSSSKPSDGLSMRFPSLRLRRHGRGAAADADREARRQ